MAAPRQGSEAVLAEALKITGEVLIQLANASLARLQATGDDVDMRRQADESAPPEPMEVTLRESQALEQLLVKGDQW